MWLYKDQSNAKKIDTNFSCNVIFRKFIRLPYTAINPSNKSIRYSRYVIISICMTNLVKFLIGQND